MSHNIRVIGLLLMTLYVFTISAGGLSSYVRLAGFVSGGAMITFLIYLLAASNKSRLESFWIWVVSFIAYAALSLAWSVVPQVDRLISVAMTVMAGATLAQLAIMLRSVVPIEVGLYVALLLTYLVGPVSLDDRTGVIFEHANELGAFLIVASLFAARRAVMAYMDLRFKWRQFIFAIGIVLGSLHLAASVSGSRRAMLCIVLVCVFLVLEMGISRGGVVRRLLAVLVGVSLIVGAYYFISESEFYYRIESLVSYLSTGVAIREQSVYVRTSMVGDALDIWFGSPLLGVGMDNFRVISGYQTYSHNNFTELLSGLGFIGLVVFYIPILRSWVSGINYLRMGSVAGSSLLEARWLVAAVLIYLTGDFFIVSYYDKSSWMAIAAFLAVGKTVRCFERQGNG